MKALIIMATCFLSFALTAVASQTAREALEVLGKERGTAKLERVVQVMGERGADQPQAWRIIVENEDGGLSDYIIKSKKVDSEDSVSSRDVPRVRSSIIALRNMVLDSKAAFQKANEEARKAKIAFDSVNYRLRCPEPNTNAPAWFLSLRDGRGRTVGEITVGARTGKVYHVAWYAKGKPRANVSTQPDNSVAGRSRQVAGTAVTGVQRGVRWIRNKVAPAPQR